MSELCARSGGSLRWVAATVVAIVLTAGLGVQTAAAPAAKDARPVPAAARAELSPLAAWAVHVDVERTVLGGGYDEKWNASFSDDSGESFDMSWSGSRQGKARFDCAVSGQNGYDISGGGSGQGQLGEGSGGIPAEWGLSDEDDFVQLLPEAEGDYAISGTSLSCDGTTTPATFGREGPVTASVFLPGTFEELAAAPVGEVLDLSYTQVLGGGDSAVETTTVDVSAEKLVDTTCTSRAYTSIDTFRAFNPGVDKPRLQFELVTAWCEQGSEVRVLSVSPSGTTLQSPLAFAVDAGVREFFTFHDDWKRSTYVVDGAEVTGSGEWEHCMGIPIIGKIKWVKKAAQALRYAATLLKKVDGARLQKVARPLAKAMRVVADAIDVVIKQGGRPAKYAARQALELVAAGLDRLPEKVQVDLLLATVAVVADWSSSQKWARQMLRDLAEDKAVNRVSKPNPLVRLFSDKLVCWAGWKPRIHQVLTPALPEGDFVDRGGDYAEWVVKRHA